MSDPSVRVVEVVTSVGIARAHIHHPGVIPARGLRGTIVLGHGAGGGVGARDLVALAEALPASGYRVVLVEQPWRVEGKKVAPPPPRLDLAWRAVLDALSDAGELVGDRLVVGGHSAGARVACRTAVATRADAAVLLAFPLHPPGRPERDRAQEARSAGVPLLVVQGERDPFGSAVEVQQALPFASVRVVPCADHGMAVPKSAPITQAEALGLLVDAVRRALVEWACGAGG